MESFIYMDHAATVPTRPEVVEKMLPCFTEQFANISSTYTIAQRDKATVQKARETIAEVLNASADEIYFTSGGSEADNWALKGVAESYAAKGRHVIVSAIEHHAVLHTAEYLEKHGYEVTYLPVDENGIVRMEELKNSIRPDTILISVMFANNEIGTIQPIEEIGKLAHEHGVLFHTDAVQAFGQVPIDVRQMHIDLLSASGHKLAGPKGIGLLYVRKGIRLANLIHGGGQERGRRAGTENVPGIVGFAEAVRLAAETMGERAERMSELRDYFMDRLLAEIPYVRANGDRKRRLPGNVNVSIQFVEGESLLIMLDRKGVCASSGSACTSGSLDPSHVLLAIGLPHEIAHGSLRFSLGEDNTKEQVDFVVDSLKEIVQRLRSMSPLYEDFISEQKKANA
ncbi:MAG: cysteine desulfurase NifS [Lachnospiraceae bacterium]